MKAKVIRTFRDKHTNELRVEGEIINITKKRYEEILKTAPLVTEHKEEKADKAAE